MDGKPQGRPLLVHTPDNLEQVIDAMLQSPRRSARPQALTLCLIECGISKFSTRICTTVHKNQSCLGI